MIISPTYNGNFLRIAYEIPIPIRNDSLNTVYKNLIPQWSLFLQHCKIPDKILFSSRVISQQVLFPQQGLFQKQRLFLLLSQFLNKIPFSGQMSFNFVLPRRVDAHASEDYLSLLSPISMHKNQILQENDERLLFFNSSIPKQKSNVHSGISSNKTKIPSKISPSRGKIHILHPQQQSWVYFPQPKMLYESSVSVSNILYPYIIYKTSKHMHTKCICNLIYFDNIITQCITYIITLHKTNFVSSRLIRKQMNIINNFQTGQRLIPETGRGNYLYDQEKINFRNKTGKISI